MTSPQRGKPIRIQVASDLHLELEHRPEVRLTAAHQIESRMLPMIEPVDVTQQPLTAP